jgi:DNA-binding transcriptional LysR family regulator
MRDLDWQLIKVFLGLCRNETFAAAAEALQVDESTVRRRLTQLEKSIGAPLFGRHNGRLQLRAEHEPLLTIARDVEAKTRFFFEQSVNLLRNGTVRISLIDMLAVELASDFSDFTRDNPGIILNITTEPHIVNLAEDEVDIAIRMARPIRGDHKLKSFGKINFGIYASSDYLDKVGKHSHSGHNLIELGVNYPHFDHDFELAEHGWMDALTELGEKVITADSYPVMIRLCEQGCGLAVLPNFLARNNPKLVSAYDPQPKIEVDVWGVFRLEMADLPRVRAVIDFLDIALREKLNALTK